MAAPLTPGRSEGKTPLGKRRWNMAKIDPVIQKETLRIALGVGLGTVAMLVVFFLLGKFDVTVLWGAILGGGFAVLNFFLLGLSVQYTTSQENTKKAQSFMQMSYSFRLLLSAAVILIGILFPCFHWVAVVIPLIFPRLVILILGLKSKRKGAEK